MLSRKRSAIVPAAIPRLILLMVVAHTGFGVARLALTLQAIRLDASPAVVGLLLSLVMVVPCVVSVAAGRWADMRGFRPPTLLGFGLLASGALVASLYQAIPGLAVAGILIGTGYMLAHVAVNNAIGNCAGSADRLRVFGWMAVGFAASGTAGPVIAGATIDIAGFPVAFAVSVVLAIIAAGMLWHLAIASATTEVPSQREGRPNLLRQPELRVVLMIAALVSLGWDLFNFLVPVHGARLGLSATTIGLVVGSFGVGSLAARIALPLLARSASEWPLIGRALGATAIGFAILPFCTTAVSMIPLGVALGVALGCGQPLVMCLLYLVVPPTRAGEAVGLRVAVTSVSQAVTPVVLGAFGAALGMFPVFWAAAAMLASGSVYSLRYRK